MSETLTYTAFQEFTLLSHGPLEEVALDVRRHLKKDPKARVLVFNDATGKEMDFDLRGSEKDVIDRLKVFLSPEETAASTGPGRPKLGVVAREISLLPRHWEWLSTQSGGASSTLRRLVDEARKKSEGKESVKQLQERTYKFMAAIAGNLPNYEEALRALFARDKKTYSKMIAEWAPDLKTHLHRLAEPIFD